MVCARSSHYRPARTSFFFCHPSFSLAQNRKCPRRPLGDSSSKEERNRDKKKKSYADSEKKERREKGRVVVAAAALCKRERDATGGYGYVRGGQPVHNFQVVMSCLSGWPSLSFSPSTSALSLSPSFSSSLHPAPLSFCPSFHHGPFLFLFCSYSAGLIYPPSWHALFARGVVPAPPAGVGGRSVARWASY